MLYEILCIGTGCVTLYMTFFLKTKKHKPFQMIDLAYTTSEILYEMKLYYNTIKVQRWWRSSMILKKRDIICEENSHIQNNLDDISYNLNTNLCLY